MTYSTDQWPSSLAPLEDLGLIPYAPEKLLSIAELAKEQHLKDQACSFDVTQLNTPQGSASILGKQLITWTQDAQGVVSLAINSSRQINLYGSLDVTGIIIKSNGAITLNDSMKAQRSIVIEANAIWCKGSLTAKKKISLKAQYGLILEAALTSRKCGLHAMQIYQQSLLHVAEFIDISTQSYIQGTNAQTHSQSLRLIANECHLNGDVRNTKRSFVVSKQLLLGTNKQQTTLKLAGTYYLHAEYMATFGQAKLELSAESKQQGQLIVDDELLLGKKSTSHVQNTELHITSLLQHGIMKLTECKAILVACTQTRELHAQACELMVSKEFIAANHSSNYFAQSTVLAHTLAISNGTFIIHNSSYRGESISIAEGHLTIEETSKIKLNDRLSLAVKAQLFLTDSSVMANNLVELLGTVFATRAKIKTPYFSSHNLSSEFEQSKLSATKVEFATVQKMHECRIKADYGYVKGHCHISNSEFTLSSCTISTDEGLINNSTITSQYLSLSGGQHTELVFAQSGLTTEFMTADGCIRLKKSWLYAKGKERCNHFSKQLILEESKLITEAMLWQKAASTISLESNSSFQSQILHSQGAMRAKNSNLTSSYVVQEQGEFAISQSSIRIEKQLSAANAQLTLEQTQAELGGLKLQGESGLTATQTVVTASDAVVTAHTSSLSVKNTAITTPKMVAMGVVELQHSLLTSQELFIYNQFQTDSTKIDAEKVHAAAGSNSNLTASEVNSKSFATLGSVAMATSQLNAEESIAVFLLAI